MSGELVLLLIASSIVAIVSLVVSIAHTVNTITKLCFGVICASLIFWQVCVYITSVIEHQLLLWNHLTFIGPTTALLGAFFFVLLLEQNSLAQSRIRLRNIRPWIIVVGASTILQLIAIASGKIFLSIHYNGVTGTYQYDRGGAYIVYIAGLVILMLTMISRLAVSYFRSKARSQQRLGLKTFLWTVILASLYGLMTNVALPLLTNSDAGLILGLLSIDIFALGMMLSIVRYRFLDIRNYIFRSLVYILTFSIIVVAYVTVTSFLATYLLHLSLRGSELMTLTLITFGVAISFHPLKLYFNRVTSRIFFRDYYDPQQVLDRIGKVLVGTVDAREVKDKTIEILNQTLKPAFIHYLLSADHSKEKRLLKHFEELDLPVISIDEIDRHAWPELHARMTKLGILLAIRLTTTHESLGYLIIGDRRSGNAYSIADKQLLSTAADTIAIGLQNALRFQEIQNFNEKLQGRIDKATAQLRATNEKLRMLDQTKDDFISMASHQLRTPLTSVKGYVSMVLDGDAGKITPLQRKLLNQSYISSQRMVYLISDLLNVSRLRTGKFLIEPVPSNLAHIIKDEIEQLQETAKGRNLELTFEKPERFPTLMLDETKIRQVIMNFIDNAIYYTPSGGHIMVRLTDKKESIEFTVTDDGMGVPKHEQHHLFSKFFRAHNAKRARPDGTGLGLFMAKKVIVAQGGAIIFRSQEGKGSTFGFTFGKAKLLPETLSSESR